MNFFLRPYKSSSSSDDDDDGEQDGDLTPKSEVGPCQYEFQEGNMTNALMMENMSPEILKVVERARREPNARFHSHAHLVDEVALKRA